MSNCPICGKNHRSKKTANSCYHDATFINNSLAINPREIDDNLQQLIDLSEQMKNYFDNLND